MRCIIRSIDNFIFRGGRRIDVKYNGKKVGDAYHDHDDIIIIAENDDIKRMICDPSTSFSLEVKHT